MTPWHSGKVSRLSDSCVRNFLVLDFGERTDPPAKFYTQVIVEEDNIAKRITLQAIKEYP